ncbi:hypothetical protein VHEMI06516 [[Torrubiella] hemipterigena]|uniref:Uncharacterized protein n=1 Tax=[Torrubiella] hemipterigena TaxID=1531966 RepID=A0A0A1TJB7_9HYPO|nr:hypothetical protein VHEMI06516 [[Torrubiella] hemipterigena]
MEGNQLAPCIQARVAADSRQASQEHISIVLLGETWRLKHKLLLVAKGSLIRDSLPTRCEQRLNMGWCHHIACFIRESLAVDTLAQPLYKMHSFSRQWAVFERPDAGEKANTVLTGH